MKNLRPPKGCLTETFVTSRFVNKTKNDVIIRNQPRSG